MHLAARELPGEPGVHGAECELAALGAFAQARAVVEQPRELGAREIGIEEEAGLAGEERLEPRLSQLVTSRRGAAVLPDDGVPQGPPRAPVPEQRGFALVGDADGGDVGGGEAGGIERLGGYLALRMPDLHGVVLHPARLREDLAEFLLGDSKNTPITAEGDGAGAGGTLIEGEDGLHEK